MPADNELTSKEAAAILGVTVSRIRQLCIAGILIARKMGRDWLVSRDSVNAYANARTAK